MRERAFAYAGNWRMILEWVGALRDSPRPRFRGFEAGEGDFHAMDPETRARVGFERARFHFGGFESVDPLMLDYLRKILELCRERGVEVRLVTFPVTQEYAAAAVDSFGVDSTLAAGLEVVADYGAVPILNYLSLFHDRAGMFGDSDHLNGTGAEALSQTLSRDLDALRRR
jgi:hypothetical protein